MSHPIPPAVSKIRLAAAREMIEAAAVLKQRCPLNDDLPVGAVAMLTRAGIVRVKVYGRNWRTIEILEGPHKGARTAPPPDDRLPYKVVDAKGSRRASDEDMAA